MPKTVSVQVEIPDGHEIVGVRPPKMGEQYVYRDAEIHSATFDWTNTPVIILRPEWQWPKELGSKFAAVAMWHGGEWFATTKVPQFSKQCNWWGNYEQIVRLSLFDWWTPPPCTDWKQSMRRNPRVKE